MPQAKFNFSQKHDVFILKTSVSRLTIYKLAVKF